MLNITNLNQYYGGSHTLWDLSLAVPKGSCTCLMGRNGMGKTTLLKCIMGLLPLASGELIFKGENIRPQPVHSRARLGIGFVPQGREIFSQLTVEENYEERAARSPCMTCSPCSRRCYIAGAVTCPKEQQPAIGRPLLTTRHITSRRTGRQAPVRSNSAAPRRR